MAEKEVILTVEGLKKMEQELEHLKTVRRREVAERIKQARQFGDISQSEVDQIRANAQRRLTTVPEPRPTAILPGRSEPQSEIRAGMAD